MFGRKRAGRQALAVSAPGPFPGPHGARIGGATGWRALPTAGPAPLQIGAFDGTLLSQFPVNLPGVQLNCGVNGLRSGWYTPSVSAVPTFQQTQQAAYLPGGQRNGQTAGAPIGPLNVAANQARVAAAQIKQSGLAAMGWAQGLSPANNPNG